MAEANAEFGRAVQDALDWMGASPETAGVVLGINARTLRAMCDGIVPMRSLLIRFAEAVARQCERKEGAPDWWRDIDAWLGAAGYAPRRDLPPGAAPRAGARPGAPPPADRLRDSHPAPPFPLEAGSPEAASPDEPPAREYYRPVYERKPLVDSIVHIFRIVDRDERPIYQIHLPATADYRARAAQVKQDLASLTRAQFDRKYGRFRVPS